MNYREFGNKVSRNLRNPPFVILQTILGKLPFGFVNVSQFYLLQFRNTPQQRSFPSRGRGYIREARPEDAYEMGQFEDKHEIFLRRFAEKEHAAVAIVDGKIVAYEWLSDKPFHIEERHLYKINIPLNAFYAYDAHILPEYRMSGLWLKLKLYAFELMGKLGRDTVISFINQEIPLPSQSTEIHWIPDHALIRRTWMPTSIGAHESLECPSPKKGLVIADEILHRSLLRSGRSPFLFTSSRFG
ncbi:MAG: hypothetical protein HW407_1241 [Bacteroidetes bacterium]|nr:hypothetical protein [Bacteroidota bacterium]